ncbi:MarR family winged helix-turn-helix transcriptional regulator [Lactovum miscens]|uniref:DNA-binding MarR family transcriptional regulator n=1 Tax=Lactovum miscens TaxID=190387 RepID=A0A841CAW1_9LACT|nr:MarR family transcriptional regulator [Lactovum miscens]MBB5888320.1 DNA-binding MarR family transcriptional regulator [Lactovum miscens]
MKSEILRQIGTISRSLDSISNVEFARFELAKGQYLYLSRIKENPGIIQHRLSELLCVDKSTANRAINKLEQKGLIVKKDDLKNKKEKRLYLTEEGEKVYPLIIRENEYSTKIALKDISTQNQEIFLEVLNTMSDNISHDWLEVKKGHIRKY